MFLFHPIAVSLTLGVTVDAGTTIVVSTTAVVTLLLLLTINWRSTRFSATIAPPAVVRAAVILKGGSHDVGVWRGWCRPVQLAVIPSVTILATKVTGTFKSQRCCTNVGYMT